MGRRTIRDLEKRLADALRELETRDRDLTEALQRQTATSEILRLISSFQTDIQPVFDAIAAKALELCRATTGWVFAATRRIRIDERRTASAHARHSPSVPMAT